MLRRPVPFVLIGLAILLFTGCSELSSGALPDEITAMSVGDEAAILLVAGSQHEPVGSLMVTHDGSTLSVKYATDADWCLTETHLHVASAAEDIPQNNGGLIPGAFDFSEDHECVTEYAYEVDLGELASETIFIAAHAVVADMASPMTVTAASAVGDDVFGPVFEEPSASTDWGSPQSAVLACNPNQWNPDAQEAFVWGDSDWGVVEVWDTPDIAGAHWITTDGSPVSEKDEYSTAAWFLTNVPDACLTGLTPIGQRTQTTWRRYVASLDVPGYPVSGHLQVNADNEFMAHVNDEALGFDADFMSVEQYGFDALRGTNSLEIIAANVAAGATSFNPNGVTYEAKVTYYPEETAWAKGISPGRNWSMYVEYDICAIPAVTLIDEPGVQSIETIVHIDRADVQGAWPPESDTTAYLIREGENTYTLQMDPTGSSLLNTVALKGQVTFCRTIESLDPGATPDGLEKPGQGYPDMAEVSNDGYVLSVDFRANSAADRLGIALTMSAD